MAKLILRKGHLFYECPAQNCGMVRIPTQGAASAETKWDWNGSLDKPTITPSIRVSWDFGDPPVHNCCHVNITDGKITFYADSTNELAGKTIEMPEVDEDFRNFLAED